MLLNYALVHYVNRIYCDNERSCEEQGPFGMIPGDGKWQQIVADPRDRGTER